MLMSKVCHLKQKRQPVFASLPHSTPTTWSNIETESNQSLPFTGLQKNPEEECGYRSAKY